MLFAFNAGVLVCSGFLLVCHGADGTVDTAGQGHFGFGAWGIRDKGSSCGLKPVGSLARLALCVIVAYGLMKVIFQPINLPSSAGLDWIGERAGSGDDASERTGGAAVGGICRRGAVRVDARARRSGVGSKGGVARTHSMNEKKAEFP